jgi:hypothetical protein
MKELPPDCRVSWPMLIFTHKPKTLAQIIDEIFHSSDAMLVGNWEFGPKSHEKTNIAGPKIW